ncbi:MAG: MFS transporter [Pseudomonadales bacterium]
MATTFLSLISLFISCFFLLLGNGLINVLLPVSMELKGMSTDTIGLVLSTYYIGMLVGAVYSKHLIKRAGHVRVFAGCVALGAISILGCSLEASALVWGAMRIVLGFCNACAYSAMESWLGASASKENRGKVLAVYNAVVLSGLFLGQFFLNFASPAESTLFIVGGIMLCASIIPIALSRNKGPLIEEVESMSLFAVYRKSPLGVVCCVVGGLIYAALFNMLPVFARNYGIVDFQLSLFMGAAILGAFFLQFPVGYAADKFDRRKVILILLIISAGVGVVASIMAPLQWIWPLFIAVGVTTGIIGCLYPLSISQAFDTLKQSEMVAAMGSMILAFSLGGLMGPYSASIVMSVFGSASLFYFLGAVQLCLAGFVVVRMRMRDALPVDKQESFVMQGATTTSLVELDPRTEYSEPELALSRDALTAIEIAQSDQGAAVKMARAIAVSQPERAVEMASALASVPDIDVLRLYEVMREALPYRIMEITRAIVKTQPDLAYQLVRQLAQSNPEQVVSVAAEIGHANPELRVDMAKVAAESAPESAMQVAEYYAQVMTQEREAMRPADVEDDNSEQVAIDIAAELREVAPEQSLDVAVTLAEAVPETAPALATELAETLAAEESDSSAQDVEGNEAAVDVVTRLSEVAPESAVDVAVAVVEALPDSAEQVATQMAQDILSSDHSDETAGIVNAADHSGEVSTEQLEASHREALETDAALELVQRLGEVAPLSAVDVAVAVVEAVPDSAEQVASQMAQDISADSGGEADVALQEGVESSAANAVPVETDAALEQTQQLTQVEASHREALETDAALELVQRLGEVAPLSAVDVAVAVVGAVPESAEQVASQMAQDIGTTDGDAEALVAPQSEASSTASEVSVETDAALELVQRLTEASPENALDVAVAVASQVPDSAAEIATEVMSTLNRGEESAPSDTSVAVDDDAADSAMDVVQRLTEAAPESALDVAVAVVEAAPESAAPIASKLAEEIATLEQVSEDDATAVAQNSSEGEYEQEHREALETEAAMELLQRIGQASPENALDVAAAVASQVPDSAGQIASHYMSSFTSDEAEDVPNTAPLAEAGAEQDSPVEVMQRLVEAAPESAMEVAVAIVEAAPEAASELVEELHRSDQLDDELMTDVNANPQAQDGESGDYKA